MWLLSCVCSCDAGDGGGWRLFLEHASACVGMSGVAMQAWACLKSAHNTIGTTLPTFARLNLHKLKQTCTNLLKHAQTVPNVRTPANTCTNLTKHHQTCTTLFKNARTCSNLHKPAQACTNMHKLAQTCPSLPKPAQTCTNRPTHAQACPSLPQHAQTDTNLHKRA